MNIANFTKRIFAYIVDILISASFVIAGIVLGTMFSQDFRAIPVYFIVMAAFASQWLVYLIINTFLIFLTNGRTIGCYIFGLRIVHNDISPITFGDAITRSASEGLIVLAIVGLFYLATVHTEKTVFDRMTNTIVVDWRNRSF